MSTVVGSIVVNRPVRARVPGGVKGGVWTLLPTRLGPPGRHLSLLAGAVRHRWIGADQRHGPPATGEMPPRSLRLVRLRGAEEHGAADCDGAPGQFARVNAESVATLVPVAANKV